MRRRLNCRLGESGGSHRDIVTMVTCRDRKVRGGGCYHG